MEPRLLMLRVGVLFGLLLVAWLWKRQTSLAGSALFGAVIVGYLSWALGGWEWLLPPLTVFLTYAVLLPHEHIDHRATHNVDAVIATAAAGLIWLFLARVLGRREFYYPFVLAFTAQLAIIALIRIKRAYPSIQALPLVASSIVNGCVLILVPFVLVDWQAGITGCTARCVVAGLVAVSLAVLVFFYTQPSLADCPADLPRWLRQATHAGFASVLGLASLYVP
jgi:phytol kinase